MSDPLLSLEIIRLQLAWLESYERLLNRFCWNEGQLNEALKSAMLALLPVIRAQGALGDRLLAAHQDLIGQYRRVLEATLEGAGKAPGRDPALPGQSGGASHPGNPGTGAGSRS